MRCRKLVDNDYSFGNNKLDYIDGAESIAQQIKTKILLFYGEWWENIGIGIPMFQSIIGQVNNENAKQSASLLIEKRIREVEGVTAPSDLKIEIDFLTRNLSFSAVVETSEGTATVEVNI